MNWQQIVSLIIVAVAVMSLARSFVHKRKLSSLGVCDDDCGCSASDLVKKIPVDKLEQLRNQQKRLEPKQPGRVIR